MNLHDFPETNTGGLFVFEDTTYSLGDGMGRRTSGEPLPPYLP